MTFFSSLYREAYPGTITERVVFASPTLNAVPFTYYILDTVVAGGSITVTLPEGNDGDIIAFSDRSTTFGTNSVFINASGTDKIAGTVETQLELNKDRSLLELTFFSGIWSVTAAESFEDFITGSGTPPAYPLLISLTGTYEYISVGAAIEVLSIPSTYQIEAISASVTTAPTGSTLIVDVNLNGVSILGNKLTIDAGEKTSVTATTPVTVVSPLLTAGSELTLDIDQVGATFPGEGLKVTIEGYWT